jgi:hypothetical protein
VEISPRADAYIEKNFPPDEAEMLREELAACPIVFGNQSSEFHERVASAVLICIKKDFYILDQVIALTKSDWRDVLNSAGLQNEDWRLGVDALLEPETGDPSTR